MRVAMLRRASVLVAVLALAVLAPAALAIVPRTLAVQEDTYAYWDADDTPLVTREGTVEWWMRVRNDTSFPHGAHTRQIFGSHSRESPLWCMLSYGEGVAAGAVNMTCAVGWETFDVAVIEERLVDGLRAPTGTWNHYSLSFASSAPEQVLHETHVTETSVFNETLGVFVTKVEVEEVTTVVPPKNGSVIMARDGHVIANITLRGETERELNVTLPNFVMGGHPFTFNFTKPVADKLVPGNVTVNRTRAIQINCTAAALNDADVWVVDGIEYVNVSVAVNTSTLPSGSGNTTLGNATLGNSTLGNNTVAGNQTITTNGTAANATQSDAGGAATVITYVWQLKPVTVQQCFRNVTEQAQQLGLVPQAQPDARVPTVDFTDSFRGELAEVRVWGRQIALDVLDEWSTQWVNASHPARGALWNYWHLSADTVSALGDARLNATLVDAHGGTVLGHNTRYPYWFFSPVHVEPRRGDGAVRRVSAKHNAREEAASGHAWGVGPMDKAGQWMCFVSNAPDLVADDTNGVADVFVHDTFHDATMLVSTTPTLLAHAGRTHKDAGSPWAVETYYNSTSRATCGVSNMGLHVVFAHNDTKLDATTPHILGATPTALYAYEQRTRTLRHLLPHNNYTDVWGTFDRIQAVDMGDGEFTVLFESTLALVDGYVGHGVFLYSSASDSVEVLAEETSGMATLSGDARYVTLWSNALLDGATPVLGGYYPYLLELESGDALRLDTLANGGDPLAFRHVADLRDAFPVPVAHNAEEVFFAASGLRYSAAVRHDFLQVYRRVLGSPDPVHAPVSSPALQLVSTSGCGDAPHLFTPTYHHVHAVAGGTHGTVLLLTSAPNLVANDTLDSDDLFAKEANTHRVRRVTPVGSRYSRPHTSRMSAACAGPCDQAAYTWDEDEMHQVFWWDGHGTVDACGDGVVQRAWGEECDGEVLCTDTCHWCAPLVDPLPGCASHIAPTLIGLTHTNASDARASAVLHTIDVATGALGQQLSMPLDGVYGANRIAMVGTTIHHTVRQPDGWWDRIDLCTMEPVYETFATSLGDQTVHTFAGTDAGPILWSTSDGPGLNTLNPASVALASLTTDQYDDAPLFSVARAQRYAWVSTEGVGVNNTVVPCELVQLDMWTMTYGECMSLTYSAHTVRMNATKLLLHPGTGELLALLAVDEEPERVLARINTLDGTVESHVDVGGGRGVVDVAFVEDERTECARYTSCAACLAHDPCGWCDATATCNDAQHYPAEVCPDTCTFNNVTGHEACVSHWSVGSCNTTMSPGETFRCTQFRSKEACFFFGGDQCGWCDGIVQACFPLNGAQPSSAYACEREWVRTSCGDGVVSFEELCDWSIVVEENVIEPATVYTTESFNSTLRLRNAGGAVLEGATLVYRIPAALRVETLASDHGNCTVPPGAPDEVHCRFFALGAQQRWDVRVTGTLQPTFWTGTLEQSGHTLVAGRNWTQSFIDASESAWEVGDVDVSFRAPQLDRIEPRVGDVAGGDLITLFGRHFYPDSTPTLRHVRIGDVACAVRSIEYEANGDESLVCETEPPANYPYTLGSDLYVRVEAVNSTLFGVWNWVDEPVLTAVTPRFGPERGGIILTITGDRFGPDLPLERRVFIEGTEGDVECLGVIKSTALNTVECFLEDAGVGVARAVRLEMENRWVSLPNSLYTFLPPPEISSIVPRWAPTEADTIVTLFGANFGPNEASIPERVVELDGEPCEMLNLRDNRIICRTTNKGRKSGRDVDIEVSVYDVPSTTGVGKWNWADPPTVTSMEPLWGAKHGSQIVTVRGTSFLPSEAGIARTVRVDGEVCTLLSVEDTELTCRLPSAVERYNATGRDVEVAVFGVSGVLEGVWNWLDTPEVEAVEPTYGPVIGGTVITVHGRNFAPDSPGIGRQVWVGDVECDLLAISPTRLVCRTQQLDAPANYTYTGHPVRVHVLGVENTGGEGLWTWLRAPTVSHLVPTHGRVSAGHLVTVYGEYFGPIDEPLTRGVLIDGQPCHVVGVSHDAWVCNTTNAAGRTGFGVDVNVTLDGMHSGESGRALWTWLEPPVVHSLEPPYGPAAGGMPITIHGEQFGADVVATPREVRVDRQPCRITSVARDTLVCVLSVSRGEFGPGRSVEVSVYEVWSQPNALFEWLWFPSVFRTEPTWGSFRGGELITVHGAFFYHSLDAVAGVLPRSVDLGGAPCELRDVTDTTITCETTPGVELGWNIDVTVEVLSQPSRPPAPVWNWITTPVIGHTRPSAGRQSGNRYVTLVGEHFGPAVDDLPREVFVDSVPCTDVTLVRAGEMVSCFINMTQYTGAPRSTVAPVPVQFVVGTRQTSFNLVWRWLAEPTLVDVNPRAGRESGNTRVTLTGTNFPDIDAPYLPPIEAFLGSQPCTGVEMGPLDNQFTCTAYGVVFGGDETQRVVRVRIDGVEAVLEEMQWTWLEPPEVESVEPHAASTVGGTTLTITGRNFGPDDNPPDRRVLVVGRPCVNVAKEVGVDVLTCVTTSETRRGVQAVVGDVQVFIDEVGATAEGLAFEYMLEPSLSRVNPSIGLTTGGQLVTLTGANFGPTVGEPTRAVLLDGQPCVNVRVLPVAELPNLQSLECNTTNPAGRMPDGFAKPVTLRIDKLQVVKAAAWSWMTPTPTPTLLERAKDENQTLVIALSVSLSVAVLVAVAAVWRMVRRRVKAYMLAKRGKQYYEEDKLKNVELPPIWRPEKRDDVEAGAGQEDVFGDDLDETEQVRVRVDGRGTIHYVRETQAGVAVPEQEEYSALDVQWRPTYRVEDGERMMPSEYWSRGNPDDDAHDLRAARARYRSEGQLQPDEAVYMENGMVWFEGGEETRRREAEEEARRVERKRSGSVVMWKDAEDNDETWEAGAWRDVQPGAHDADAKQRRLEARLRQRKRETEYYRMVDARRRYKEKSEHDQDYEHVDQLTREAERAFQAEIERVEAERVAAEKAKAEAERLKRRRKLR